MMLCQSSIHHVNSYCRLQKLFGKSSAAQAPDKTSKMGLYVSGQVNGQRAGEWERAGEWSAGR